MIAPSGLAELASSFLFYGDANARRCLLVGNDVDSLRASFTFTELQCDK